MSEQFSRTEILLGSEAVEHLSECRVAVFGIGGVGGYVCEALARSGVGTLDLIDDDKVCMSNINRQIIATTKTVGRYKTEVMKERILDINPDESVETKRRSIPGSTAFVPSVAGLIIAGEVIKDLTGVR